MDAEMDRPQAFGAGVSVGVLAGILLGTVVTLWLGDAALDVTRRVLDRVTGRGDHIQFELLLQ